MFGAIAAYILGLRPWVPDHDRLMTMVEWQGGPQQTWIPYYKPITAVYEDHHISNEIILFIGALVIGIWGYKNRDHKVDRIFARGVLGLCAAGATYLLLLWLARQHVEGSWTAVPPRLMKYEVDTPEQSAKDAASEAEWEAFHFKQTGLTRLERDAQWEKLSAKAMTIFFLFTIACAFGANSS